LGDFGLVTSAEDAELVLGLAATVVMDEWCVARIWERLVSKLPRAALAHATNVARAAEFPNARLSALVIVTEHLGAPGREGVIGDVLACARSAQVVQQLDALLRVVPFLSGSQLEAATLEILRHLDRHSHTYWPLLERSAGIVAWRPEGVEATWHRDGILAALEKLRDSFAVQQQHNVSQPHHTAAQVGTANEGAQYTEARSILANLEPEARQRVALEALEALIPSEPVLLGTSAPEAAHSEDEFTARFVACIEGARKDIEDLLVQSQPDTRTAIGLKRSAWRIGARVTVLARSASLAPHEQEQSFDWSGSQDILDFTFTVPPTVNRRRVVITFQVSVAGLPLVTLNHELEISPEPVTAKSLLSLVPVPKTAFASYSWEDWSRVRDKVSALRSVAQIDVFVDRRDMVPGPEIKPQVASQIEAREVFLLFWSQNARRSEWVDWEWHHARDHQKTIYPQPLEPPTVAPFPLELGHLNFYDPFNAISS
jgi:hypothetical protein